MAAGGGSLCDTSILKIENSGWYTDVAGKMWVVGELSNISSSDRLLPQLCISIRSPAGEHIERRYAGPLLLRAGERVTFSTLIENPPPGEDFSLSFAAISQPADTDSALLATVYRDLKVTASVRPNPDDKEADVYGIVTNIGGLTANNIFVVVGLYNAQGALVGVAKGKVSSLETLDPGATLTFTLASSQLSQSTTTFSTTLFVEGQISKETNSQ